MPPIVRPTRTQVVPTPRASGALQSAAGLATPPRRARRTRRYCEEVPMGHHAEGNEMRHSTRRFSWATLSLGCGLALLTATTAPGVAAPPAPAGTQAPASAVTPPAAVRRHSDKNPTAFGTGGAVASVDPEATAAGLAVLKRGG